MTFPLLPRTRSQTVDEQESQSCGPVSFVCSGKADSHCTEPKPLPVAQHEAGSEQTLSVSNKLLVSTQTKKMQLKKSQLLTCFERSVFYVLKLQGYCIPSSNTW